MEALTVIPLSLAGAYCLLVFVALFYSDKLIFPAPPSSYVDNPGILKIPLPEGELISGIYLRNPSAEFVLLYSHGNGEDLGNMELLFELYRAEGFSVFAYDYPGYGTSKGIPTEKNAYASIDAAYRYLTGNLRVAPSSIIAVGRSVGSGPAVDLASRVPLGGVIIESGFVSAFRVMTRFPLLPWDKFNNIAKINKITCPILIIHGTRDEVISFWHGKALLAKANQPKSFLWVEGGDHNHLIDFSGPLYWETFQNFRREIINNRNL